MDSQILSALQKCEEFLNLRFNHNLKPIGGENKGIQKGALMHIMLQHYYLSKRDGKGIDDAATEALRVGKLAIEGCQYCIAGMKCTDHKEELKGFDGLEIEDALETIETFKQYHEFWRNDSWTTINVEHVKGKVIYEDDTLSLLWKAKIDWEVDTLEGMFSVDHKTASRRENTIDLNNQFKGQCIVTEQSKMFINKIGFQKTLKPNEKFERIAIPYTKEILSEWVIECASYAYDLMELHETGRYRHRQASCKNTFGACIFAPVCSGQPTDRERIIREKFKMADKVWDVNNDE